MALVDMQQNITSGIIAALHSQPGLEKRSHDTAPFLCAMGGCAETTVDNRNTCLHFRLHVVRPHVIIVCFSTWFSAQFPWTEAVHALDSDHTRSVAYFQQLLDTLVPYLVMPPKEKGGQIAQCRLPTDTSRQEQIDCKQYPMAFTGRQRKVSALCFVCNVRSGGVDIMDLPTNYSKKHKTDTRKGRAHFAGAQEEKVV